MIVLLYLTSFVIMFPYYELFKNAIADNNLTFGEIMTKHWIFFFIVLPFQFIIAIYLTYFEAKKMKISKDKS